MSAPLDRKLAEQCAEALLNDVIGTRFSGTTLRVTTDHLVSYARDLSRLSQLTRAQVHDVLNAVDAEAEAQRDAERAQIVAWMREAAKTGGYDHDLSGPAVLRWASMIERGDHLHSPSPA